MSKAKGCLIILGVLFIVGFISAIFIPSMPPKPISHQEKIARKKAKDSGSPRQRDVQGIQWGNTLYVFHKSPNPSVERNPAHAVNDEPQWWEGGSLHKATIKEWQIASYENRLATCADFIAAVEGMKSLEDMNNFKIKAANLEACITETAKAPLSKTQPIAELGRACLLIMK